MIRVRFQRADGSLDREVEAPAGTRLLEVAQSHGQPLEGTCEGAMACSTCHVIVDPADWGKLPPASAHEEDMLDFAAHVRRTSRLSCQVVLDDAWGELTVRMPASHVDMKGR